MMNQSALSTPAVGLQNPLPNVFAHKVKKQITGLDTSGKEIFESVEDWGEDDLVQIRELAPTLGVQSWLVEIVCDAELCKRDKLSGGRGKVDKYGVGICAEMNRRAAEFGCSWKTIQWNVRIFQAF